MLQPPVTRRVLARELVLNAARRPLNLAVPAAVAIAGLVLAWWLLPIAVIVYLAMVVATVLDGDVAERVGRETYERRRSRVSPQLEGLPALAPPVNEKLGPARAEEARLRKAIADAPVALQDLGTEVDGLMDSLEKLARRADTVYGYLEQEDAAAIRARIDRIRTSRSDDSAVDAANEQAVAALEDQLRAIEQLERQLSRFDAQMEHIAATLGAIHAQVVRMSIEEEASAQSRVAGQVRDLRREVGAAADAMQETYRELG